MRDKRCFLQVAVIVASVLVFGINAWGQKKPATVKPIPFEKLGSFLVDLPGWKADGSSEGRLVKTRRGPTYTESGRYYGKGDKEIEIIIVDGANNWEAYEDYEDWKEEVGLKGLDIVGKANVSGHPAIEVYETDFKTATLLVLVKNRILVTFEMDEADRKDDLKLLAKHLDWKGIEALISSTK